MTESSVAGGVCAVILAAGQGSRFGADKRRALLPSGEPLLQATLARYQQAALPCVVVVDRCDRQLQSELRSHGVDIVTLAGARSGRPGVGMGNSLAAGVRRVAERGDVACMIALADMPWVKPASLRSVADAVLAQGHIVVPCWRGERGHPVAFAAPYFAQLQRLRGDRGARALLERYAGQVRELATDDRGVVADIDTPSDLPNR